MNIKWRTPSDIHGSGIIIDYSWVREEIGNEIAEEIEKGDIVMEMCRQGVDPCKCWRTGFFKASIRLDHVPPS